MVGEATGREAEIADDRHSEFGNGLLMFVQATLLASGGRPAQTGLPWIGLTLS